MSILKKEKTRAFKTGKNKEKDETELFSINSNYDFNRAMKQISQMVSTYKVPEIELICYSKEKDTSIKILQDQVSNLEKSNMGLIDAITEKLAKH